MKDSDALFTEALAALDRGDADALRRLIEEDPRLVSTRLSTPKEEGYFRDPYLLWFVAGNPTRSEKMPENIVQVTRSIIDALKQHRVPSIQHQLDYTLGLVSSGCLPRQCGVQQELIDLLIDNGAHPDGALNPALIHRETAAVRQLLERGAVLTLPAAISTNRKEDIHRLAREATKPERQIALAMAAFYGQADTLSLLIELGIDLDAFNSKGFHSHSVPLHQAIISGSLEVVKVLVEAGADLRIRDKIYFGIPLGWAQYGKHVAIATYLREKMASEVATSLLAAGAIQQGEFSKAVAIIAAAWDI